jgi:hypothetical protein
MREGGGESKTKCDKWRVTTASEIQGNTNVHA